MKIEKRTIALKNGLIAELASAEPEEAEAYLSFAIQRAGESEMMLRDADECGTPDDARREIERFTQSPDDVMLIARVDGQIVGCAELERKTLRKRRHRAELSIGTLKVSWGTGLGGALMQALIDHARQIGVERLELHVFEGNDRAIALYKRFGFVDVGFREDCVRLRDGTRLGAHTMHLNL